MSGEGQASGKAGPPRTLSRRALTYYARRAGQLARAGIGSFMDDRCTQMAATISYYALFALFPLVILAASIFGLVQGEADARQSIIDLLTDYVVLTPDGEETLESALEGVAQNSGVFGAIGLVGLVFSGSGVMSALRNAINTAFDVEERRPPVHGKVVDITLVLFLGIAVGVSLGVTLVGRLIPDLGEGQFMVSAVISLFPIALNFGIFSFLFYVMPAMEVRWRDIWPGALFAALGYEAAKFGFAFYLSSFGNYSAIYGSVAAIIIFMFFVYIVANVFLLGAEIASEWGAVRSGRYDVEPEDEHEHDEEETWDEHARAVIRKFVYRRE